MKSLLCLLFIAISLKGINSYHILFSRHSHDTIKDHGALKQSTIATNLFLCGTSDCQIIRKVSISENNTFNCKDDVLMINFDYTTTLRNQTKIAQPTYG